MNMKQWKAKRRARKEARRDPYDRQEIRILDELEKLDVKDPEYSRLQTLLKTTNTMRSESRESRRRLTKEGRGNLWGKILGILGTVGGIVAVAKFEKDGGMVTGEKRTIMDALCRAVGNFLHRG